MSRGSRNPLPAPSLKIIAAVKRDCAKQTCQCDEGGGVESQTPVSECSLAFTGGKEMHRRNVSIERGGS